MKIEKEIKLTLNFSNEREYEIFTELLEIGLSTKENGKHSDETTLNILQQVREKLLVAKIEKRLTFNVYDENDIKK